MVPTPPIPQGSYCNLSFKAVTRIASSPLKIDLSTLLAGDTLQVLAGFLRKNQRALKLSTLLLFDTLVR